MSNRYKILILAFVLFATCLSCNHDVLDLKPLNAYSEVDVFNDKGLLQNYVNGIYRGIHQPLDDENSFLDGFTDNAFNRQGGKSARQYTWFHNQINTVDGENMTRGAWQNDYNYIRNCNIYFEKTKTSTVDPSILAVYSGEVHFLRAYYYFDLLSYYGGVPIITKTYGLNEDYDLTRNSIDEVVNFIVSECDAAATACYSIGDQTNFQKGHGSIEAAMALKARTLLYAASPLYNPDNDQTKWQKAADANKAVKELSTLTLAPDAATYGKMFHGTDETEVIFARYFSQLNQQSGWGGWSINLWLYSGANGGWSDTTPTQDFVDSYELTSNGKLPNDPGSGFNNQDPYTGRDPRFYQTVLYQGASFYDPSLKASRPMDYSYNASNLGDATTAGKDSPGGTNSPGNNSLTGYNWRKYTDEGKAAGTEGSETNINPYIFFRTAEFYLNYAETQIELANLTEAVDALNALRSKRGLTIPIDAAIGKDSLILKYRNERRVELALEDHRFFDIRRWKIADLSNNKPAKGVIVLNNDLTDATKTTVTYKYLDFNGISATPDPSRTWDDRYYWLPIPPSEITLSNGKLTQNPLWK